MLNTLNTNLNPIPIIYKCMFIIFTHTFILIMYTHACILILLNPKP